MNENWKATYDQWKTDFPSITAEEERKVEQKSCDQCSDTQVITDTKGVEWPCAWCAAPMAFEDEQIRNLRAEALAAVCFRRLLERAQEDLFHTCDASSECLACDVDITLAQHAPKSTTIGKNLYEHVNPRDRIRAP